MDNNGRLTRDGFAVAFHLIQSKLAGKDIPSTLPPSLVPPSKRGNLPAAAPPQPQVPEAIKDLLWDDTPPQSAVPQPSIPTLQPQRTGVLSPQPTAQPTQPPHPTTSAFGTDPFAPTSSPFGNTSSPFTTPAASSPFTVPSGKLAGHVSRLLLLTGMQLPRLLLLLTKIFWGTMMSRRQHPHLCKISLQKLATSRISSVPRIVLSRLPNKSERTSSVVLPSRSRSCHPSRHNCRHLKLLTSPKPILWPPYASATLLRQPKYRRPGQS